MAGRFSDAERRRILRAWLRSGLSSHDFAAARGVSHATLYKWKRELGATGSLSRRRVGRGHRLGIARDFDPETLRRVVETLTDELAR